MQTLPTPKPSSRCTHNATGYCWVLRVLAPFVPECCLLLPCTLSGILCWPLHLQDPARCHMPLQVLPGPFACPRSSLLIHTLFSVLFRGLLTTSEFIHGRGSTEEELAIHIVHLSLQAAPSTGPKPLHDICPLASDFLVDSADDEREKLVRGSKEGTVWSAHCFP